MHKISQHNVGVMYVGIKTNESYYEKNSGLPMRLACSLVGLVLILNIQTRLRLF